MNEIQKFVELFNKRASENNPLECKCVWIGNLTIYCDELRLKEDTIFFKKNEETIAFVYVPYMERGLWFKDVNGERHSLCRREWVMK